jgi:hypothetical protein
MQSLPVTDVYEYLYNYEFFSLAFGIAWRFANEHRSFTRPITVFNGTSISLQKST